MISCDTNLLLHAFNIQSRLHNQAKDFLRAQAKNRQFVICELILIELYVLLRNPAVVQKPLSSEKAVEVCRKYRQNQHWAVVDYRGGLMNEIWKYAAQTDIGRRAIFDARLALTLQYHGVTEFATRNTKHFQGFGFKRVWDPLE